MTSKVYRWGHEDCRTNHARNGLLRLRQTGQTDRCTEQSLVSSEHHAPLGFIRPFETREGMKDVVHKVPYRGPGFCRSGEVFHLVFQQFQLVPE